MHEAVLGLSTTDITDATDKSVNDTTREGSIKNIDDDLVDSEVPIVTGPKAQNK